MHVWTACDPADSSKSGQIKSASSVTGVPFCERAITSTTASSRSESATASLPRRTFPAATSTTSGASPASRSLRNLITKLESIPACSSFEITARTAATSGGESTLRLARSACRKCSCRTFSPNSAHARWARTWRNGSSASVAATKARVAESRACSPGFCGAHRT